MIISRDKAIKDIYVNLNLVDDIQSSHAGLKTKLIFKHVIEGRHLQLILDIPFTEPVGFGR